MTSVVGVFASPAGARRALERLGADAARPHWGLGLAQPGAPER